MELVDVASFFDRVPAVDPASGHTLFHCQVLAYDESKRDAFTAYRRMMSLRPDTTLPVDRVVELHGVTWIVGDGQLDGWSEAHRRKHVLHRAGGRAQVYRLSAWLSGTANSNPYADLQWVKDVKELEVSSRSPQKYVSIFASSVDLREYDVVSYGGRTQLVTSVVRSAAGYMEGFGMLQEQPLTSVTLAGRTYNPATGGYAAASNVNVNAMRVRWQELYGYEDQLAERYQEGDCTWVLPSSAGVSTSTEIVSGSDRYSILAVRDVSGCRAVHARLK